MVYYNSKGAITAEAKYRNNFLIFQYLSLETNSGADTAILKRGKSWRGKKL